MSILRSLFGFEASSPAVVHEGDATADTEAVRRIARELEALEPERARYLAAFAFVLARVANAEQGISDDETREMERIVASLGGLPETQAVLAVEMAKSRQRLFGGTDDFVVTREFNAVATRKQKEQLLHCLFAVSAADDRISLVEENAVRQIATELGFDHDAFSAIRAQYNAKRSILRK